MVKKKIEVTIRNDKGETTFYHQQIVDDKNSKRIQVPLGKIIKEQTTGKVNDKQSIH